MLSAIASFGRRLGRFWRNQAGGTLVTFALAAPPLMVVTASAIDLSFVMHDKTNLQALADSAALAAAKQLGVTDSAGIETRAGSFVSAGMTKLPDLTYSLTTSIPADASSLTVQIKANRLSFFANMLPPGGWNFSAKATAVRMGKAPLCVISTSKSAKEPLTMTDSAQLNAPGCLIQANSDITIRKSAWLKANTVQSSGLATGNIAPAAQTGAPAIDDPFSGMVMKMPLFICNPLDILYDVGLITLGPGVHCGNINVDKNATVNLLPGEHYFYNSHLALKSNSTLTGRDVVLVFDDNSDFQFQDGSIIDLEGRRSGNYAGFVVATTRTNTQDFEISSNNARKLLGTIYVPNATLHISGTNNKVADQSAWTVIVARDIQLDGAPNLVINSNYAGSSTPVPQGVGPQGASVRLGQ